MVEEAYKKPITIHEAKKYLEGLDIESVDQIQRRTLDYILKFSRLDPEKARSIVKKLIDEIGLTEEEAIELVNVMPSSVEEVRAFTMSWRKLIPSEKLEKILSILHS